MSNRSILEDGVDPKAIRKCPIHVKYEGNQLNNTSFHLLCSML